MGEYLLDVPDLVYPEFSKQHRHLLLSIALRIKELRKNAGITQEEFYIDTNIHVARIETGKQNISVSTLLRICGYLGITIQDFFLQLKE
ncbi:MAG TPA: helix-turn-helix transcriptional regulator [Anseongella sp.]|nr:helix-turn-helix transcriptional regulator [Anseongella sp.]